MDITMDIWDVIIIVCTLINIAGCTYNFITLKEIVKKKGVLIQIRDDIIGISKNTTIVAEGVRTDLEKIRLKSPHVPTPEEIDEALKENGDIEPE